MYKHLGIVSAVALLATASSALAADIVYQEPAPYTPPVATVYDWSGAYIGLQGGYVWTDLDIPGGVAEDFNGGTLGAHVGANWQNGSFVFGLEGDVNYTWNENSYVLGGVPADIGTDWTGSIRVRAGVAMDRTLIYGTGGLALARGYIETPIGDESETFTGWTAGVGVEHAFTDNWTARLEYRYSDYGSDDFGLGLGDFDLTEHAVRVGFSFKF